MTDNHKFDVALSFAGEQRKYVNEVAKILESNGIKVFYDEFYQSHLWGKDMTVYFKEVYYSNSDWCIMFLSKEYVTKAWPSFERENAMAKALEVKDGYILPVKFDDTEIPGLPTTIAYQDGNKKTPEDIAKLFLEKMGSEKN